MVMRVFYLSAQALPLSVNFCGSAYFLFSQSTCSTSLFQACICTTACTNNQACTNSNNSNNSNKAKALAARVVAHTSTIIISSSSSSSSNISSQRRQVRVVQGPPFTGPTGASVRLTHKSLVEPRGPSSTPWQPTIQRHHHARSRRSCETC